MALEDAIGSMPDFTADSVLDRVSRSILPDLPENANADMVLNRLNRKLSLAKPAEEAKAEKPEAPTKSGKPDFSSQGTPIGDLPDLSGEGTPIEQAVPLPQPRPAGAPRPGGGIGTPNILDKAALQGAAGAVGGPLQGAAALYDNGIPATPAQPQYDPMGSALGTQSEPAAAVPAKPLQERTLYKAGKAIKDLAPTLTPEESDTVAAHVGRMGGAIVPYAIATVVNPLAGMGAGAVGMGLDTFGTVYDQAKEHGASDEVAQSAAGRSALVAGVLGSLPLGAGKYATGLIGKVASSSAAFATAGEAQEAILQQIAKDYDPKAGYSLDQKRLIAELILGAGMGGLHHAFEQKPDEAPQQPQQNGTGPQPTAGAIPPGNNGTNSGPRPGATGPQPGAQARGPGPEAEAEPAGAGPGPQPGPDTGAPGQPPPGAQPGPEPGKPPPGTGEGVKPDYTMDPKVRAKMERVYRMYDPKGDPSKMSDADLFNAVNEHLRDTSSTGYTAKPESPEEAQQREFAARERQERDALKAKGWTDAHINAMTAEQRAKYMADEPKGAPETPRSAPEEPPINKTPGTREAPIRAETADDIVHAQPAEPTPAQAAADNYKQSHIELPHLGLSGKNGISIETGVGGTRKSKNIGPDGKPEWEVTLEHAAYGKIRGTTGADGDHLDVFVGPHPTSPHVFVLDQLGPDGKFDEHKVLAGYRTPIDAMHAYANSYTDGAKDRIGGVTAFTPDQFKDWLKNGDHTKPLKKLEVGTAVASPAAPKEAPTVTGAETAEATPKTQTPAKGSSEPLSLLQFIASKGGVAPHPELDALDLSGKHRVQLPGKKGFFGVVRPGGMNLDTMREAAEEAGYLKGEHNKTSTIRDLLDAVDEEYNRGNRKAAEGEELAKSKREQQLADEREQHDRERDEDTYGEARAAIEEAGYTDIPSDLHHAAARLMLEDGLDADSAMERAAIKLVADESLYGVTPDDIDTIFGHGAHDEIRGGRASEDGGPPAPERSEGTRPREGEEDREAVAAVPDSGSESVQEQTAAHRDAIEEALGPDAEKVAQVDIGRAAEIMVEQPGIDIAAAFGRAVVENAVRQKFLTALEAAKAYGPEVEEVLGTGGEGTPRSGAHAIESSPEPREVSAGSAEETGVVPSSGKTRKQKTGKAAEVQGDDTAAAAKAAEQPAASGEQAARNETSDAAENKRAAKDARDAERIAARDAPTWAEVLHKLPTVQHGKYTNPDTDLAFRLMDQITGSKKVRAFNKLTGAQRVELYKRVTAHSVENEPAVKDGNAPLERITSVAVLDTKTGKIYSTTAIDRNHADLYEDVAKDVGISTDQAMDQIERFDDGFITSTGRFVDRELAARIANAAGQAKKMATVRAEDINPALDHTKPVAQINVEKTVERGADNKDQIVIPGAERASDATMAQRAANAPLKPRVNQKAADVGLFGDEQNQSDLLDAINSTPKPDHSVTLGFFGDPTQVIKASKAFWTSTFQPELVSDRALLADPVVARYKAAQAQEKDAIIRASEHEWNYWNKRNDAERIRFLDDVETAVFGSIPSDPVQARMAKRYRRMLDENWRLEKQYGSQAAFVEDYFPHIWEQPDAWRAFSAARSAQMGPTWFQKKRTIDYITDGLAAGLKLKYTNPVDIVVHRLLSGVDMRQRMELLYQWKDQGLAWEGVQGGPQLVKRGWVAINAPDRKQWVIHPDVQLLWKNGVDAKGLWQAEHVGGSMFRGWMALKNAWVPVKLAISAFHPLHVLHINYSNGMAMGWDQVVKGHDPIGALKSVVGGFAGPLQAAPGASTGAAVGALLGASMGEPVWGGMLGSMAGAATYGAARRMGLPGIPHPGKTAREAWATRPQNQTPEQKAVVALMTDGGFVPQLAEQMKIGAQRNLAVAWQKLLRKEAGPNDWLRLVTASMRRSMEKLQAPIFEQWIPNLKAAAYLNQAAALLKRRPELLTYHNDRRVALRAIAKSIDNRFGEMFYGNLFWNRYLKDSAIGSFLSLGWNLGFVREFGGAAMEAVSRPAGLIPQLKPNASRRDIREATNKIAFAIAYMGSSALILGMMSMLMDDEHRAPEGLDWIFPRVGGVNPDGTPRRIANMSYIREVPMLIKHIQERGGNVLTGAGEMLWNKLMFEPFSELLNNRDYYGYNIWDENAPIYKQVWQGLKHTFGDQSPMTLSGARHAAELSGKTFPSLSEAASNPGALLDALRAKGVDLSMLGFGPAPAYVEKSAIQNRIGYLYSHHVASESRPHADEENSHEKMAVRTAIMIAKRDHDSGMLSLARERGRAIGLSPEYMADLGKTPTDVYLFSRLPDDDQRSILMHANPDEKERYLRHAHAKVRIEINRQRYAPQQTGDQL